MTKEKMNSLTVYLTSLKFKLKDPTPEKHKNHPKEYRQFLEREISMVEKQLERAKHE